MLESSGGRCSGKKVRQAASMLGPSRCFADETDGILLAAEPHARMADRVHQHGRAAATQVYDVSNDPYNDWLTCATACLAHSNTVPIANSNTLPRHPVGPSPDRRTPKSDYSWD